MKLVHWPLMGGLRMMQTVKAFKAQKHTQCTHNDQCERQLTSVWLRLTVLFRWWGRNHIIKICDISCWSRRLCLSINVLYTAPYIIHSRLIETTTVTLPTTLWSKNLHNFIFKTRRVLGGAHVPPTKVFRRLTASVNKTTVKPRVAAVLACKTILKPCLAAATNTYTSDFPKVKLHLESLIW